MRFICKRVMSLFTLYLALSLPLAFGQPKQGITLEDIFVHKEFAQKTISGINWMSDGRYYTTLISNEELREDFVIKFDITTGLPIDTLFSSREIAREPSVREIKLKEYSLSKNEDKILLATNVRPVYRHSFVADYFVYDLKGRRLINLSPEPNLSYATFSPDGKKVAFVRRNNLFYVNLDNNEETQVTTTGKENYIINGSTDWVYEEEFAFTKAFFWSPDSRRLAFYTFDESNVKEYNLQLWEGIYPTNYYFKYPKAGEENSKVNISVYDLDTRRTDIIDLGKEPDFYIPRVKWTNNPHLLAIFKLNRHQNNLEIIHANTQDGTTKVILREESPTYIDINNNDKVVYLLDNSTFLLTSEKDGFKHIYLHHIDGKQIRQITTGNWEVDEFIGLDEKRNLVYYTSTEVSPMERHLYSINLNGKQKKKLSSEGGTNSVDFSTNFEYYINKHSSVHKPQTINLYKASSNKLLKTLEDNQSLREKLGNYNFGSTELFTFSSENTQLNGYIVKPSDFDPNRKYPVLMYVYGGPGDQRVNLTYYGNRELWHHFLTQKGFIVAVIDNRGTGGRGKRFRDVTYMNLGKHEVADQIAGARYLSSLPYIDAERIGIWGWSYGGYMSSLAILLGNEVFKTAIAVAPVTSWRFYDTIYTERYLRTPQENPEGYDAYSPINHADKLTGNYLLIHGTGDDNVHLQNAIALQEALIHSGKQFDAFYYPNKNHSISGDNVSLHLYNLMTNFIEKAL